MKTNLLFKLSIIGLLAFSALAIDIVKYDRQILKGGLHRELETNFTIILDEINEYKCDIIVRETITKDIYVYFEEVNALGGF
jgi:hypothetical protein